MNFDESPVPFSCHSTLCMLSSLLYSLSNVDVTVPYALLVGTYSV